MHKATNNKAAKLKQQNEHRSIKKANEKLNVSQGCKERFAAISIFFVVIRIQQTIGKQVVVIIV